MRLVCSTVSYIKLKYILQGWAYFELSAYFALIIGLASSTFYKVQACLTVFFMV